MLRVIHDEGSAEGTEAIVCLDELCRRGAQEMLSTALQAEVADYVARHLRRHARITPESRGGFRS